MKLKYEIKVLVDENGNKSSVLMTAKTFKKLMNDLENLQDLDIAFKRMKIKSKPIPYDEVMKELLGHVTKK